MHAAVFSDARLALVQARCDFLNGGENRVTEVQRRLLDAHYAIEQPARSWAGQVVPFNGTCGIWRRAAIEVAGGWQGDTIAEDMDVSYRVQMMGWHVLFLSSVAVPGELPRSFTAWRMQQFRWTKGSAEVTRKILPSVWRSHLRLGQKIGATFHLGQGAFGPLFLIVLVTGGDRSLLHRPPVARRGSADCLGGGGNDPGPRLVAGGGTSADKGRGRGWGNWRMFRSPWRCNWRWAWPICGAASKPLPAMAPNLCAPPSKASCRRNCMGDPGGP